MSTPIARRLVTTLLLALAACGAPRASATAATTPLADEDTPAAVESAPPPWKVFAVDALKAERAEKGVRYLPFLEERAFRAGLYHLPVGAVDGQEPHALDEVYWVHSGRARASIDGEELEVEPGAVIFVAAGVEHGFHSITEDLDLIVLFVTETPSAEATHLRAFDVAEQARGRASEENAWNPFLVEPSLVLGNYMLPQITGGDSTLVHKWQEFNLVTRGRGRFTMGADSVDIGPGTLMFVERGVGHFFHDLQDDLDVLILWENP